MLPEAVRRGTYRRSVRAKQGIFFAIIFQFSGWALVVPLCFALQVPDVRGLQVPGPPCASCSNFAHEQGYLGTTYVLIGYTRSWSRSKAVRFQATHGTAS